MLAGSPRGLLLPSGKWTFFPAWNYFRRHEIHFSRHENHFLRHEIIFGDMKSFSRHEITFPSDMKFFRRHEIMFRRHEIFAATWNHFLGDMKYFRRHEMHFSATWNQFWLRHEIIFGDMKIYFLWMNKRLCLDHISTRGRVVKALLLNIATATS